MARGLTPRTAADEPHGSLLGLIRARNGLIRIDEARRLLGRRRRAGMGRRLGER